VNKISIIGMPMDLGQLRRGVDMGPSAIRYAGITERLENRGFKVEDLGDIQIGSDALETDPATGIRNLTAVVHANEQLMDTIENTMEKNSFPLILGGDHSIAIGTLAGVAKSHKKLGVIWFDAHGDLNTPETSPSGNIHGMPLAASLGIGDESLTKLGGASPKINPENVVIIGARSLDPGEKELIREKGIKVYTMHEIDRIGMSSVIDETIAYFKNLDLDGVHLSFDLDSLDPLYAPGVGTPVPGGVTFREAHLAMELFSASELITSAEFVEVNPILDEHNKTGTLAVDMIGSLFGERIL
jgi:arginase